VSIETYKLGAGVWYTEDQEAVYVDVPRMDALLPSYVPEVTTDFWIQVLQFFEAVVSPTMEPLVPGNESLVSKSGFWGGEGTRQCIITYRVTAVVVGQAPDHTVGPVVRVSIFASFFVGFTMPESCLLEG